MAFAGLANVSPSNDAVCFLWELMSEAQTLNLTLSPTPFLLALLGATKALLFPSFLHPGASCRHLLAFLLLGALADSSLWSPHPALAPPPGPGSRQADEATLLEACALRFPTKWKGTQTFQSHRFQSAHRNMRNPSPESLSFTFLNPYPHVLWIR